MKLQFLNDIYNYDLLCLTETHTTKHDCDQDLHIQNYNLLRCDSTDNGSAGIILYIKDNINFKIRKNITIDEYLINILIVEVNLEDYLLVLMICYRSPSFHHQIFIDLLNKEIEDQKLNANLDDVLIITGDFNMKFTTDQMSLNKNLLELLNKFDLTPRINQYTRMGRKQKILLIISLRIDMKNKFQPKIIIRLH